MPLPHYPGPGNTINPLYNNLYEARIITKNDSHIEGFLAEKVTYSNNRGYSTIELVFSFTEEMFKSYNSDSLDDILYLSVIVHNTLGEVLKMNLHEVKLISSNMTLEYSNSNILELNIILRNNNTIDCMNGVIDPKALKRDYKLNEILNTSVLAPS